MRFGKQIEAKVFTNTNTIPKKVMIKVMTFFYCTEYFKNSEFVMSKW